MCRMSCVPARRQRRRSLWSDVSETTVSTEHGAFPQNHRRGGPCDHQPVVTAGDRSGSPPRVSLGAPAHGGLGRCSQTGQDFCKEWE